MKIDGLVVCVDYAAELRLSLDRWLHALNTLTVVTTDEDRATGDLFVYNIDGVGWIHKTEAFYANGAKFNKAAAMQEAIIEMHPWRDWVLLIDADVIPPVNLREQLEAANLKPGILYGARRHQSDPSHWDEDPTKFPLLPDREMPGYFQLFHVSDPVVADRANILNTTYTHAGNYDSEFQNRWGRGADMARKRWLKFPVLHIGEPGVNWCGRGNHEAMIQLRTARAGGHRWTDETIERAADDDEPDSEKTTMKKTMRRKATKRKTAKKTAKKKTGRPKGKKTTPKRTVNVMPGRCLKCGSTSRTPYKHITQKLDHGGTAPDGKPYNRITWRPTKCLVCQQHRVDKIYENVQKT